MYEEVDPELAATTTDPDLIQANHMGWSFEEYMALKQES